MDVFRLIEEVKKRPGLWDVHHPDHRDRVNAPYMWKRVAEIVGVDADECKRKWKNLRDSFRAEIRRTKRRVEKYKHLKKSDPRGQGISRWAYFVPMSFLVNAKKKASPSLEHSSSNSNSNSHEDSAEQSHDECEKETETAAEPAQKRARLGESPGDDIESAIKKEPDQEDFKMASEFYDNDDDDDGETNDADADADNEMLFEEFTSLATPQAMRRLSHSISVANAQAEEANLSTATAASGNAAASVPTSTPSGASVRPIGAASVAGHCKCSQRVDEQVNFLENLEREEEKLIQSTRLDISRCKETLHIGDSDYNFLISFLPLMKRMSEMQNIHFRAKMSELLVHTMGTPPQQQAHKPPSPTINQVIATPIASFNPAISSSSSAQPQLFLLQQAPNPEICSAPALTNANTQVTTSSTNWN